MPKGWLNRGIFLLLVVTGAGLASIIFQTSFTMIGHGPFLVLILFFLGSCAWHVLQVERAGVAGGDVCAVAGQTQLQKRSMVLVSLVLLASLLFVFRVVTLESLTNAVSAQKLLMGLTVFLAFLLLMVRFVETRVYRHGVLIRGQFFSWNAIASFKWQPGQHGLMVLAVRQGRRRERPLNIRVEEQDIPDLERLLMEHLSSVSDVEQRLPEAHEVSLLP